MSPDGRTLACSGCFEVTLWDATTGKLKSRIAGMPDRVNVVLIQRIDKSTRIISGCHDGRVLVTEPGKAGPVLNFIASPGW